MTGVAGRAVGVGLRRAGVVVAGLVLLSGAAGGDGVRDWAQGRGLAETGSMIGFEHARVGGEYWVNLPLQANVTGEPLTVLRTEWLKVPQGLRVVRYGVVTLEEMDGYTLGVSDDASFGSGVPGARVHAPRPITVAAHSRADAYVLARVKVTAPVQDNLAGYRVWYRQGAVVYRQDLAWEAALRLRPEEE